MAALLHQMENSKTPVNHSVQILFTLNLNLHKEQVLDIVYFTWLFIMPEHNMSLKRLSKCVD